MYPARAYSTCRGVCRMCECKDSLLPDHPLRPVRDRVFGIYCHTDMRVKMQVIDGLGFSETVGTPQRT